MLHYSRFSITVLIVIKYIRANHFLEHHWNRVLQSIYSIGECGLMHCEICIYISHMASAAFFCLINWFEISSAEVYCRGMMRRHANYKRHKHTHTDWQITWTLLCNCTSVRENVCAECINWWVNTILCLCLFWLVLPSILCISQFPCTPCALKSHCKIAVACIMRIITTRFCCCYWVVFFPGRLRYCRRRRWYYCPIHRLFWSFGSGLLLLMLSFFFRWIVVVLCSNCMQKHPNWIIGQNYSVNIHTHTYSQTES